MEIYNQILNCLISTLQYNIRKQSGTTLYFLNLFETKPLLTILQETLKLLSESRS